MDNNLPVWEPLESSHVESFKYHDWETTLYVRFKWGGTYEYPADPEQVQGLRDTDSPGRYMRLVFGGTGVRVA
jgi:hypothetical protein